MTREQNMLRKIRILCDKNIAEQIEKILVKENDSLNETIKFTYDLYDIVNPVYSNTKEDENYSIMHVELACINLTRIQKVKKNNLNEIEMLYFDGKKKEIKEEKYKITEIKKNFSDEDFELIRNI